MECGTECWDGILGQEGQQWCLTLQHPMAISSWGGRTWAEAAGTGAAVVFLPGARGRAWVGCWGLC